MKRKIFRNLTSQEEAQRIFLENIPNNEKLTETVRINEGIQRVLANDVFSSIDIPPFDRAAMDGFAVIASDTFEAEEGSPVKLQVIGELKAGYVYQDILEAGYAVEISTGAPLPTGANAVVMVEYTDTSEESIEKIVNIYRSVSPYENTMAAGADIQIGERVLAEGTVLTSRELAVLSAIGYSEIEVYRRPFIGVFSSGDEIVSPGDKLPPGKLYDINSTAIMTSIIENGGKVKFLGILQDNEKELVEGLKNALSLVDMLLISGGTSAGMGDMLYQIIDDLGEPGLLVHGVKVKPGKPTILAVCNGIPVVGLPGYPASALSIFQLFVQPLVRSMAGLPPMKESNQIEATINQRLRSVEGRYEFKPVYLMKGKSSTIAYPVPGGSGAITSVALADGFVQIPENISFLAGNTKVKVHLISPYIQAASLQIIGSHDIALAQLLKLYEKIHPEWKTRSVSAGSQGGIAAIRRGEAHIAGIHVLDKEKGYNQWVADELDAILVKGYKRMQGFLVRKGNPKEIFAIPDLLKENVRFVNRNEGSGTRILLDLTLEKIGIDPTNINGYTTAVRSHSSIAQIIERGLADVGIAIKAVQTDNLDFIEFRQEEYDFLINKEYIDLLEVQEFIKILQSDEYKSLINSIPGYVL